MNERYGEVVPEESGELVESVEAVAPVEEQEKPEENEEYKQYMLDHPDVVIASEDLRECGPEIAEFEDMIASFESEYSLAELHLITDLRPEDISNYPLRESAKIALGPIVALMNMLKIETNISFERHEELKAQYRRLSQAVGMINNNKVDHTR